MRDSLASPPAGLRDVLYPESARIRGLCRRLMGCFSTHGYDPVMTPLYETEHALRRGVLRRGESEWIRFVDPDSGEVSVLRRDMTPQVARMAASRFRNRPVPWKISYEGQVSRRMRGRSKRPRQVTQVGVECIGLGGALGSDPAVQTDSDTAVLMAEAAAAVGLGQAQIELGHAGVARALLSLVPVEVRGGLRQALVPKDQAQVKRILQGAQVPQEVVDCICGFMDAYGDPSVLGQARKISVPGPVSNAVAGALNHVQGVTARLERLGMGDRLHLDLLEPRDLTYYSGLRFGLLSPGPGELVASGGRYDGLLHSYGVEQPAIGFAFDVGHLLWALECDGASPGMDVLPRVVCAGPSGQHAQALREQGWSVNVLPGSPTLGDALAYARQWNYQGVVWSDPDTAAGELAAVRVVDSREARWGTVEAMVKSAGWFLKRNS